MSAAPSYLLRPQAPPRSTPVDRPARTLYRAVAADTYSVSSNGNTAGNGQTLTGYFAVLIAGLKLTRPLKATS